jgi:hypothetical protein
MLGGLVLPPIAQALVSGAAHLSSLQGEVERGFTENRVGKG